MRTHALPIMFGVLCSFAIAYRFYAAFLAAKVFPFVFISIMCGAISGFHSLVSSGTTPKMLSCESHARPIGYGAMLIEGLVGVVALAVAGTVLVNPGRARYLWVTPLPMVFVTTTTTTTGVQLITGRFLPRARLADSALAFKGRLNIALTVIMLSCVVVILADTARRWIAVWRRTASPAPELDPVPYDPDRPPDRCC